MSQSQPKKLGAVRRFLRWIFGAPFKEMGEPFGDPVPPEMRKFEAESAEISNMPRGDVMPKGEHHHSRRPARK
jgi:hypothetical protein